MTIPYFAAKGKHDNDWGSFGSGLEQRMAKWGIAPEYGGPTTVNYSSCTEASRW